MHALRGVRHSASDIRYRYDVLSTELTSPHATSVAIAIVRLYDAVESFEATIRHLQAIAAELAGEVGEEINGSLGELVLHLRVFAILSQIEQLDRAIHGLGAGVELCVLSSMARVCDCVSRMWLEYGHLIRTPGGSVRRDVIREAQRAITTIGSDPDVMFVLRIGMARPDWPAVFCPCANIAELLELTVDVEPDAALFQAAPDPDLIDDLPAAVQAGIRRDARKP